MTCASTLPFGKIRPTTFDTEGSYVCICLSSHCTVPLLPSNSLVTAAMSYASNFTSSQVSHRSYSYSYKYNFQILYGIIIVGGSV